MMKRFSIIVGLSAYAICAALAIQIGRGLNRPVDSISSISSLLYRHTGYIDQKVRGNAYNVLNHESYHLRNVVAAPNQSWNTSSGPSNITSDSIAVDESFVLPDTELTNSSTNASSSSRTARLTDIPMLYQPTEALATNSDTDDASWNNHTNEACVTALSSTLNGIATNPSGMSACYNIRSFDSSSGVFQADLRLFRIAAPTANWTALVVSSETLDVTYASANITSRGSLRKRDLSGNHPAKVARETAKDHYLRRKIMSRVDKTKRESPAVTLPPVQAEEAKDMWLRRVHGGLPKMLQGFTFTATMDGNVSAIALNETTIHFMLMLLPNITFSGTTSDGATLSTQLSTNDASFVNGLFTQYSTFNISSKASAQHTEAAVLKGNTFAVFPVGLVITSVWTLLLLMTMGYGTWSKIQARDAYRRKVRNRMSGGMGRRYTSSELEMLSKQMQAWM